AEERAIALMEEAERLLEPPLSQKTKIALSHFHDHVKREQLELAWDAITEAGAQAGAPPAFWRCLRDAASLMGLEEQSAEAVRRGRAAQ
ncbi:MAG: hypothetical protein WBV82_18490, partial [Myxococcaceae bacterium]